MNRKLSVMESKLIDPYPARPTPLAEIFPPSIHSSIEFSVPANAGRTHHPPPSHPASQPSFSLPVSSPPPLPLSHCTKAAAGICTRSPPFGFSLPPCNPAVMTAPALEVGMVQKLWRVAKPSIPVETLQGAMDYACGEYGADYQEIMPNGSCFDPDTVVAHSSYALNSYWQKTQRNERTCSFRGNAMIINANPSKFPSLSFNFYAIFPTALS